METPLLLRSLPPRPHPRYHLGHILFRIHSRLGFSDTQFINPFAISFSGYYVEGIGSQTKTSERSRRGDGVPFAAPRIGITGRDWGAEWLCIRDEIMPLETLSSDFRGTGLFLRGYTLLPIKVSNRVSIVRVREILLALGVNMSDAAAAADHSAKVTTLSWGGRRGFSMVLAHMGDHSHGS